MPDIFFVKANFSQETLLGMAYLIVGLIIKKVIKYFGLLAQLALIELSYILNHYCKLAYK